MVSLTELNDHFPVDNLEAPLVIIRQERGVNGKLFKVTNDGWAILKDLPKGQPFKRKEKAIKLYVKGHYNKTDRAYSCAGWDDINDEIFLKSNTKVFVDFTF
jgi:nitrogen fixation protein